MPDNTTTPTDAVETLPSLLAGDALVDAFNAPDEGAGDDDDGAAEASSEAPAGKGAPADEGEEPGNTEEGEGEGAAEAEAEAPAPKALPDWSKPVQNVQQEMANLRKQFDAKLDAILQRLEANPTQANQAAAAKIEEQKDLLAEIEADVAQDGSQVAAKMLSAMKQIQAENRKLAERMAAQDKALTAAQTRQEAYETGWKKFQQDHPDIGRKAGEELLAECMDEVKADANFSEAERPVAAKMLFWQKVKAKKANPAPTAQAGKPAAQVSSSGGRVAPTGGRVNGTLPKPQSLDDQVKAGKFKLSEAFG